MSQTFRSFSMPLGMVVGALFCRWIVRVDTALEGMLTPTFIFTMLFFTFCDWLMPEFIPLVIG